MTEKTNQALEKSEGHASPQAPPPFLEKWVENQSKEIENRQREIEFQKQSDDHNFEYAKLALHAQENYSEGERSHASRQHTRNLIFFGLMTTFLISFLIYSLHTGKDQVALEIIKAAIFIASGGAGGYALGIRKSQDKNNTKN